MQILKITSLFKLMYLAVIILLLLSYFRAKDINTYNLDGLGIIETSSIDYPIIPKKIKSLELTYKGLSFTISNKSPLIIKSDDGIRRYSQVKNIKLIDKTLQVSLENKIVLNFRVDNRGERLTIGSSIPKVFPTIKEIILPFTLNDNFTIEKSELSYKINNNKEEFHLKLNDKYYIDESRNNIHMIAEDDKISTLTFSPLNSNNLPLAEQWYMLFRLSYNKTLEEDISEYLYKIESHINSIFNPIRYIQESDSWQKLPTIGNFTEDAVITYLSQAMKRGLYQRSLNKIKGLKSKYPYMFSFQSTAFLGNIIENGKDGISKDNKIQNSIKSLIKTSDPELFEIWIPEHLFEGGELDIKTLETIINSSNKSNLSLEGLSISLYNLVKILETESTNSNSSNSVKEITDLILQKITWDKTGIYLIDENSISNQKLNLKIGKLLIEASQYETSTYSKPIGEGLIRTFLSNSDKNGGVKTTYNIQGKTFSKSEIPPEESFLLLSDNPYIPHYVQNEGIKIWTISNSIVIDKSTRNVRIIITYPVDKNSVINSHFLTISGLKPYKQLYFKGKLWRGTKEFERFGVGYYYEHNTELLYFMPNHTKPREEIVITY